MPDHHRPGIRAGPAISVWSHGRGICWHHEYAHLKKLAHGGPSRGNMLFQGASMTYALLSLVPGWLLATLLVIVLVAMGTVATLIVRPFVVKHQGHGHNEGGGQI